MADRLVGVPNVQPPLPTDWEVRPTHPVHRVPYQLAQFWDRGARQRAEDKAARLQAARKKQQRTAGSATGLGAGEVPRDLRETAKRSPAVRGWLRALEEPVRRFLAAEQDRRRQQQDDDSAAEDMDSEDEEIVFVGRSGAMRELREKREARYKMARREVEHETVDSGVVFDSFGDGESAAYKWGSLLPVNRRGNAFTDLATQALAHSRHLRLLRPRVSLRHPRPPSLPRRLRRPQAGPAAYWPSSHQAASSSVGALLSFMHRRTRQQGELVYIRGKHPGPISA